MTAEMMTQRRRCFFGSAAARLGSAAARFLGNAFKFLIAGKVLQIGPEPYAYGWICEIGFIIVRDDIPGEFERRSRDMTCGFGDGFGLSLYGPFGFMAFATGSFGGI